VEEPPSARIAARQIAVRFDQEVNLIFVVLADRGEDRRIGKMKEMPNGSETENELSENDIQVAIILILLQVRVVAIHNEFLEVHLDSKTVDRFSHDFNKHTKIECHGDRLRKKI
jgi:hypothetical protein